ncbi:MULTISPECIES: LysR family transcriptional regulator [Paenibacillus]|uniref:LysR family transcriptional regulator n=1 Tax=Paenibacillus naphthalenovorans TaxID=162209 RepID=A0A0U2UFH9_9BACL|nr:MULTISPECIES: LysR family transcriptional regulator [Paenibacillus]ALS24985.1 LysR family transcriptional regulator [Paenibacillus naphthalenovorans]GCL74085.1 LysR family transcriptional regulator [Paenibacillus naphthalenovorans]SDJ34117.1 DNA-binding transcriptional regulator, LysR family [Paenibacillus naphthalenovorans]
MEIHQLEYILAVEKYKSFSLAADEVCLSQSALSHSIRKLEEELGVRIFERTTRSVQPTPAGAHFLIYAKRILGEIKRARQVMLEYNNLERGHMVIGAIPNISYLGLTALIASFQKAYPGIHIEIRDGNSDELIKWLQVSEIDAALLTHLHNENYEKTIDFYPLMSDQVVLITHAAHPLAHKKIIDLAEASKEKFLSIKPGYGMRSLCEQACQEAGFVPNIMYESSQVETICGLVAEGLGVALLTSRVVKFIRRPGIAIVRLKKEIKRTTALAIPRGPDIPTVHAAFRDFTMQWIKQNAK